MGENMTDLTKITAPLGLLDEVYGLGTQAALKAHGGPYEYYSLQGWMPTSFAISLSPHLVIRAKPQPLTKPSIDWSHVAPQYKWLARDESGYAYIFTRKPHIAGLGWVEGLDYARTKAFASYTPGTCDWRDSLVERPE